MCNRETNVSQLVAGHTLVFAADTVSGHAQAFRAAAQFNLLLPVGPAPVLASLKRSAALDLSSQSPGIPGISLNADTHPTQRRRPLLVNGKW